MGMVIWRFPRMHNMDVLHMSHISQVIYDSAYNQRKVPHLGLGNWD